MNNESAGKWKEANADVFNFGFNILGFTSRPEEYHEEHQLRLQ
jgi:hypothetical protein